MECRSCSSVYVLVIMCYLISLVLCYGPVSVSSFIHLIAGCYIAVVMISNDESHISDF